MVCGKVSLTRRHDRCVCGWSGYLADDYLGLDGFLSVGVRRLACLSANGSSFAVSARHLEEYCGLKMDAETVRRHCEREARAMGVWLDTHEVIAEVFAEAEGEPEFQTDAGKVNTTQGWKDLKVASFARRPLARSARPEEWKTRKLPEPSAKIVMTAIAPIEEFIPQVEKQLDRLAIAAGSASSSVSNGELPTETGAVTKAQAVAAEAVAAQAVAAEAVAVAKLEFDGEQAFGAAEPVNCLGDGAGWIWRASQELFEQPRETLDFYHGTEAIGKYTRRQYGDGTEAKKSRYERGVTLLLTAGDAGIRQFLTEEEQLLKATRKTSAKEISTTTMWVTMLLMSALTMPTAPAETDAADEITSPTTEPTATNASWPKGIASPVPSPWDDDDIEGAELEKSLKSKSPQQRIDGLRRYFTKHANRLNYADRLSEGRAIGSGMIEGNIKTLTLRLKARGARWLQPNVVAMSRLCCLCHGTFWTDYWKCTA